MNIFDHIKSLEQLTKQHGKYQLICDKTGLNYHWLQKFAIGRISNPTVSNINKLERFFYEANDLGELRPDLCPNSNQPTQEVDYVDA